MNSFLFARRRSAIYPLSGPNMHTEISFVPSNCSTWIPLGTYKMPGPDETMKHYPCTLFKDLGRKHTLKRCGEKKNNRTVLNQRGFPGGSVSKESTCRCRRHRFNPWVRKIPREGNGNPLQYSCLRNPVDMGYSTWGCKRAGHELATKQQQH